MSKHRTRATRPLAASFLALVAAGVLIGAQAALAETTNNGCMQDLYGSKLNCTANDIQLSTVRNLEILDDGCAYPGDTVSFTAEFETVLTAQARHDIGIYFGIDGDPNLDGALTGSCSISTLDYQPDPPWLDLDMTGDNFVDTNISSGIQDTCGDIDDDHNPLYPEITLYNVPCIDTDADGQLNLPYCTSWRQPGANELCTGPLAEIDIGGPGLSSSGVIPGAPSKCNCDTGYNVPIDVPPAGITVTKTAMPTSVNEPSGSVTFAVVVALTGIDPNNGVTVDSLIDDIHGNLDGQGNCAVPFYLTSGAPSYSCSFTATVSGNGGDSETDTVTASGVDDRGNPASDYDDATVNINDVQPNITVVKTANPTEVLEPGGSVTFSILVTNNSVSSDPVTLNSLMDTIYGDLTTLAGSTCTVGQILAGNGGTYSCSFTAYVEGNAGDSETDVVTASGTDDEGNPVSDNDDATVTVKDVPSAIDVVKTANPTQVYEPGGSVTFSVLVTNISTVDTVTINSLVDTIYGDLTALAGSSCTVPQLLAANGGSYSCSFTANVSGNADDSETDVVTAAGVDDDGQPVDDSDSATVTVLNVPPSANLLKNVTEVLVTYSVQVCNTSTAEDLYVDALADDIYGDIADDTNSALTSTTCAVPQTLAPSGEPGNCYTCSFQAVTSTSPTTDTVTGTVSDDEGGSVTPSDSATVSFGTVTP